MNARVLLLVGAPAIALIVPSALGQQGDAAAEVHLVATNAQGSSFAFQPMEVTVSVGDTVRWINDGLGNDDVFHTVTSSNSTTERRPNGLFDHTLPGRGDTFEHRVDRPGTFAYYCKPHSGFMFGTVKVDGASSGGGDSPGPGWGVGVGALAAACWIARGPPSRGRRI